ncbi:hypothetical protein IDM30_16210 [Acinetobacter seifertii]|nr:hypothetical protein [Acinetobacter seifertii]
MQEAYCPQASRYLTIVRRWIVHTIDSHHNFRSGSFTVPVNAGVLSLVNAVVTATVGATASTTAETR